MLDAWGSSQLGKQNKLATLFQNHVSAARISFRKLILSPSSTFMTIAVIAIALALPAGLYCGLSNLTKLCKHWHPSNQISLYLHKDIKVEPLVTQIKALPGIATVDYISPEQGLNEFERALGVSNILAGLKTNPIPAVIQVRPQPLLTDPEQLQAIKIQLGQMSGIENAKLDSEWVQRLNEVLNLARRSLLALTVIFSLAVVLVISNTIRLNIENQKQEIEIMSLIGATHSYIRRPFLYHGLFYGSLSGLFSWTWVNLFIAWLRTPAHNLSTLYHSSFRLDGFNIIEGSVLIALSGLLGLIAAGIVVRTHANGMEFDAY